MANPLPNENEIYEKIKKENITVDPLIWELLSHNIRNDIHCISLSLGGLRTHPQWILKFASFAIKFLYKISRQPGEPEDLIRVCDESLERVYNISDFLTKLKEATYRPKK
jgi:hypothetical protein